MNPQALVHNSSCSPRSLRRALSLRPHRATFFAVALLSWLSFCLGTEAGQTLQQASASGTPLSPSLGPAGAVAARPAARTIPTAVISDVVINQVSKQVSVRVEGDGHFVARPYSIPNPERLVLDFVGTHLAMQNHLISSNLAPVRAVRVAQHTSETVRIVVDLDASVPFQMDRDGGAVTISFPLQAKTSSATPGMAVKVRSLGGNAPPQANAKAPLPSKDTSDPSSPAAAQESKKTSPPALPDKGAPSKQDSPAPAAAAPSAPETSAPTNQVMTPFGPVTISQAPSTPSTQPPAQPQNPGPSTQPPPLPTAAQNSSHPQASPQDSAPGPSPGAPSPVPSTPSPTQPPSEPSATLPQAAAQSQVAPEDKQPLSVALNLENADLYQVLRIIGSELRINYVVDPAVKGTVTINTSGSISRADLFSVLESILQINGAAIVKQDSYYRVVPATDAKVHPVPLQFAKTPDMPPSPGETLVLQVFPMHFVSAVDMSKVLAPFISPVGQVIVNEKGHVLLVMETPPKLKQVADILGVFDNATFSRQRVRIYSVVNNSAKNIITELQDVFGGYSMTGSSAIRFVPIESLNGILAISPTPEAFADIETWIHQLDQPAQQVGEQNYVYPVQNAKANELRDILVELYGGSIQKVQPPSLAPNPQNPMVSPAALEEAQRAQLPQTPERVQGRIHIMSDQRNNALIIQASPHDYEIIKHTIAQLDLLPRQVLIDAKIYSVDLTGNLSLGISYYLGQQSTLPGPLNTNGSFAAGQPSGGSLVASTFAIISQTRALQMFLNATDQRSRLKVLSAPSILVTDNTSARIQVGASVPVPIGSSLTPVQSNGSSLFAQTIQYMDTGVILTVTPHINSVGVVTLTLNQEVSSAVPNSTSGIVAPVINKSTFQTTVVLADGEPLALGGIITTTDSVSKDRIPGLGEIPFVGALFGTTTRKTERNEIVLLLTPHVMLSGPQASSQSQEFLDRMRETKKNMEKMN